MSDDTKWNRISFGKCKYGFLIEAFKHLSSDLDTDLFDDKTIARVEQTCEKWAKASMRILDDSFDEPTKPTGYSPSVSHLDKLKHGGIIGADEAFDYTKKVPF